MDIQELKQFESVYQPSKEITFCWGVKKYVQLSTEENHTETVDHANDSLRIWQAAKAQDIPEGFVVVPEEPTERMLDSAYSSISDNLHNADLENIYKAMIAVAQEQAND